MRNLVGLFSGLLIVGCSGSSDNARPLFDDVSEQGQDVSFSISGILPPTDMSDLSIASTNIQSVDQDEGQLTDLSNTSTNNQSIGQNEGQLIESTTTESEIAESNTTESEISEPNTAESQINRDNFRALLIQAFEVFSGRAYDDRLNKSRYVSSHDIPVCESGSVDQVSVVQYNFNNCVVNGETLNGQIHRNLDFETAKIVFSNGFNSDIGGLGEMRVTGAYERMCCSSKTEFRTEGLAYDFSYAGGYLHIHDATVNVSGSNNDRVIHGEFGMQGSSTNNAVIFVKTGDWLNIYRDDSPIGVWGSNAGTVAFTASDGSALYLQANNGDLTSVEVTITNVNGVHTTTESLDQFIEAITWSSSVEVQSLHHNAGNILNKLAGDDLITLSLTVDANVQYALETASSVSVDDAVITFDSATNPPTEKSITTSSYQCSSGGAIARTQTTMAYQEGGFYSLGEYSDSDLYVFTNCAFLDVASSNHSVTLNGQYKIIGTGRSGRKHSSGSNSHIWLGYHQVRTNGNNERSEYFVDAKILKRSHNNDGSLGGSREVTISNYERTDNEGIKEVIDTAFYSQGENFGTYSGIRQRTFNVSGNYMGPLTDYYLTEVATQLNFDVQNSEFAYENAPENIPAKGEFTLMSANGDSLNIALTGSAINSYYLATFNTASTDGVEPLSLELPFFRYLVDGKGFAVAQWTIPVE